MGRPVRGVLRPPGRPGHTRVVLRDGRDLGSSVANDLPLVDADDSNVPWPAIAGTVRRLAARPGAADGRAARDGLGIPVVDATAEAARSGAEPSYDRTDALHAAVSALRPLPSRGAGAGPGPGINIGIGIGIGSRARAAARRFPAGRPRVRAADGAYRHIARSWPSQYGSRSRRL
ncbi:hypothetical protein [Streptomyces virginiae]|uniref:hypothetical protein n=1 Tax=Streptomyces virginiae TaxID=1961 RepID=UPI002253D8B8|nr:hypothetical protein [Streptomyces virginiae]MCX4961018.1 hypothetical protein [Streptomyces virginiae]